MRTKSIQGLLIVILLIIVPLLAACSGGATTTAPTTEPTPSTTTTTTTEPATTTAGQPTVIPHTLEGRDNCLMCHETGVGEAKAIPANHAGKTNADCTTCHKTAQ
ncbi:MAG: multiheme c-type cytochrome [Chloroflexota bacterium]